MAETIKLTAQKRDDKPVNELRKDKSIPVILYGPGLKNDTDSIPLSVVENEMLKVYRAAGTSTIIELTFDKEKHDVLVHDYQVHPVKGHFLHIDFLAVKKGEKISATIPLQFIGESAAVKIGGLLNTPIDKIDVKVLPKDLVPEFEVDISKLENFGDHITLTDLKINPNKFEIDLDLETVIASVAEPKVVEEKSVEEGGTEEVMPEITGQKEETESEEEEKKEK